MARWQKKILANEMSIRNAIYLLGKAGLWRMKFILLIMGVLSMMPQQAFSSASADLLPKARLLFYSSLDNEAYLSKALDLFEMLRQDTLYAERAQVYIGALTAVKAKYDFWPHTKLKHVKRGLSIMEKAINENPNDIEALFIYASTCYHLPAFFKRKDDAQRQFRQIAELLPGHLHLYPADLIKNVIAFISQHGNLDQNALMEIKSLNY
jgi:hypothetical protein